ncbi:Lrp/AsnC family transcriptional regulator [Nonomuraea sp. K274]|uniref:Lrp/AsnC family transcriptional regulator n=1 Tax=Nonomuraea cypriaca TaxID=1187855 RepID=A0A931F6H3_9ACTN|nr:Lrp/AsnC family transcriptional regulator [Nonomuraea cypriaca]MBF8193223.1 Lrp/AsnC family transcriptional regulator [Nonomuraea cypriaca]
MEDLDDLDRKILAALHVNGRASWTDLAQLLGISTTTVARRAQHLFAAGLARVAVLPHLEHEGPVHVFIVRLTCSPGSQLRVAGLLAKNPDIRFVTIVTGGYDIVFELVAPKHRDLYTMLVEFVHTIPGTLQSDADLVLHTYKVSYDWSVPVLGERAAPFGLDRPAYACERNHLDDVDREVLAAMREDGRASFQSVGRRLGISESTARRRLEGMLERGCASVATFIPAAALGYEAEILFWLSVEPRMQNSVAERLSGERGVRMIASMLGQASLMCEVIVPTTADIHRFTSQTLASVPGIRSWTAGVQVLTVKRGFLMVPWAEDRIAAALA